MSFYGSALSGTAPYTFTWNFGDGETVFGQNVTHFYIQANAYTVSLSASDAAGNNGSKQLSIPVGSWNPSVPCSPVMARITDITDNATGSSSLTISRFNPGITSPTGTAKRWLDPGATPSGWIPPGPPCTVMNTHGTVSMFVEIDGVKKETFVYEDCRATYNTINGGQTMPPGHWCDNTGNICDPAIVTVSCSSACTSTSDPMCIAKIHSEWDGDWMAALEAGPLSGNPFSNNNTWTQATNTGLYDVQGFVYWDPDHLTVQWHSFSGWEIHPFTAWRVHSTPPTVNLGTNTTSTFTGQAVAFTSSATGGKSPYSFAWDFGDGTTATGASAIHNFSVGGSYVVHLAVRDSVGQLGIASATITVASPDFSITANPTSVKALASTPATSNITLTPTGGLTGIITLTSNSQPSTGLSCSFNPAQVTIGTRGSSLLTCSGSPGNYTVAVNASTLRASHSIIITYIVQDFRLSATPSTMVAISGTTNSSLVGLVATNGFSGNASLVIAVVPSTGLACSLDKNIVTLGSVGSSTLNCSGTQGTYQVTITGTSNGVSRSVTVAFIIRDYLVTATTPSPTIAGQNSSSTILIQVINGFAANVTVSAGPLPSGLACSPITPFIIGPTTTANIICTSSQAGNYPITFSASTGAITHTTTTIFNFTDFLITGTSPTTAYVGLPAVSTITVVQANGFNSLVNLTTNSTTCILGPTNTTGPGISTLSCAFATASTTSVTITGTSGSLTHTATVTFVVQDFTIGSSFPSISLLNGTTGTAPVSVGSSNGFSSVVYLTTNNTLCIVAPPTVTGSGGTSLSCTFTTAGTFYVAVTGASGSLSHSMIVSYFVQDYTITASNAVVTLLAGSSGSTSIALSSVNNFNGLVSLSNNSTSCMLSPSSFVGSGASMLSCNYSSPGTIIVTVNATSASLFHVTTVTFVVQDFAINGGSPVPANVNSPTSSMVTITSLNQFSGTVNLTDTLPSSLVCSPLSPLSLTGSGSSSLACTSSSAGIYNITITASSASLSHAATLTFVIQDFTIGATSPSEQNVLSSITSTISINSENGFSSVISLSYTSPTDLACGTLTPSIITGSGQASLSCTSVVAGNYTLTLTSNSTTLSHAIPITFMFGDFTLGASPSLPTDGGQVATSTITVSPINGFAGGVLLSSSAPAGLMCVKVSPTTISGSGSASVSCTGSLAGNYTVQIVGIAAGSLTHTVNWVIQVTDFSLSVPGVIISPVGSNATSIVTVTSVNGYAGNVTMASSILNPLGTGGPGGQGGGGGHVVFLSVIMPQLTGLLTPPSQVVGGGGVGQYVLTIILPAGTASGNYTVVLTASDGRLAHSVELIVVATDFSFSTPTSVVTLPQGANTNVTLNLQSFNWFQASLNITAINSGGLLIVVNPSSLLLSATATAFLTIFVPSNALPGNYTLTIQAASAKLSRSVVITVIVVTGLSGALVITGSHGIGTNGVAGLMAMFSLSAFTILSVRNRRNDSRRMRRRFAGQLALRVYEQAPNFSCQFLIGVQGVLPLRLN